MEALHRAVESALGGAVLVAVVVRGGDVAQAFRIDLVDGRRVFAKTHPDPPPGFFTTEANGVRWLRDADAIPVPEVLGVSDGSAEEPPYLVLEWIEAGSPGASTEADLGRSLAWSSWPTPTGSSASGRPTSPPPDSTATSGRATGWATCTVTAGSSTRPPMEATASSTSP